MRPIDADTAKVEMMKNKTPYENTDDEERRNVVIDWCIRDIENAPTIEAIPIEWIKNWLNNCTPNENCVENLLFEWECEEKENADVC